jgi:acetyl esterase/lipase
LWPGSRAALCTVRDHADVAPVREGDVVGRAMLVLQALLLGTPSIGQAPTPPVIRLWPGPPPGVPAPGLTEKVGSDGMDAGAVSGVAVPRMEVYRPARPNGTAVVVIGGGGYFRIQIGSAARPIARALAARGVTAFVLFYRLPGDGWPAVAPFQDGQRAVRLVRDQARRFGIDPAKVGVIGLSAGGNLAGILATRGEASFYPAVDAADRRLARPGFVGLIYPVVSLAPPIDTTRTARWLRSQPDSVAAYSVERHVGRETPPVFLAHALDDPIADPRHSLLMAEAMRAAGRPVELHLFARGGHSWGLGRPDSEVSAWLPLFARWAAASGFPIRTDR